MSVLTSPYRQAATASTSDAVSGNHGTANASGRMHYGDEFEFDDDRIEDGFYEPSAGQAANSRQQLQMGGGSRRRSAMVAEESMLMSDDGGGGGSDRRGERGRGGSSRGAGGRRGGGNSDTDEASEAEFNSPSQRDENEPMEIKEQMYQDKLASLKRQMNELTQGSHPEFVKRVKKLDAQYRERLRLNEIYRDYLMDCVDRDYGIEKRAAGKEYEEKRADLKENLLTDFEDKRKMIESERHSMELAGDTMDVKPTVTRKLRRRPNDPVPVAAEKRRKPTTGALVVQLDEREIDADLKLISRGKTLTLSMLMQAAASSPRSSSSSNGHGVASGSAAAAAAAATVQAAGGSPTACATASALAGLSPVAAHFSAAIAAATAVTQATATMTTTVMPMSSAMAQSQAPALASVMSDVAVPSVASASAMSVVLHAAQPQQQQQQQVETRIEDGKLLYERRWYHRGQPVYVEGKDVSKFAGTVSAIGNDVVWVKKLLDNSKVKINTFQLARGKITIKRRAN